jgi:manganese/zinc/iron transport system permease protein
MLPTSILWNVMLGAALLGAAAGFVGTFAVLRRRALVGDMLSHAALPGIAIVFMVWQTRDLLALSIGALGAGLLGVACVAAIARWTRTSEDAALGIVLSAFFGLGVVLLTVLQDNPAGNKAGLDSFLFGEIASLRVQDIQVISIVAALLLVFVLAMYKELKLLSFDTGFAAAQGWPVFWLDLVIMAAIAVVTIIGLPICGVILMAAMLIAPAAAARFWTNRLGRLLAIASLFGGLAGIIGCLLAAPGVLERVGVGKLAAITANGLPPGPLIVLAGAGMLLLSMVAAPERGILARWWHERELRHRVERDHLMRAIYELSPAPESKCPWIDFDRLADHGGWNAETVAVQTHQAMREGLVERVGPRLRFTPSGYRSAAQLVRAHRLWELYRLSRHHRSIDDIHHDADDLEHLLSPESVDQLEQLLIAEGRLPATAPGDVPRSPHAIEDRSKQV